MAEWITGPQQHSFYTKQWVPLGPPKAAVFFLHGFVEHIGRYEHVFSRLADEGIVTFAFDQRGFGHTGQKSNSLGRTSWDLALGDASFFLTRFAEQNPSLPLFLYGHSMGGALTLAFATAKPPLAGLERLAGAIATSPLIRQARGVKAAPIIVRLGSMLGKLSSSLTLKVGVDPSAISRDPAVNSAYEQDPLCKPIGTFKGVSDMLLGGETLLTSRYRHWPATLPLLLAHGTGDLVTECEASREFVSLLQKDNKPAEFRPFEGYYHEMQSEPGELKWAAIDAVREWILKHAAQGSQIPVGGSEAVPSKL